MKINILDILVSLFAIAAICLIACIAFFLLAMLDIATGWFIAKITHLSLSISSIIVALHVIAVALYLNRTETKSLLETSTATLTDNSDFGIILRKKGKSLRRKR